VPQRSPLSATAKAQTPLVRFFVDLLYSFSTCCGQVENHTPLFRIFVDLLSSPRQIHNIFTCGDVVDLLWICRKVVDLLWIRCTSCTVNPQQIEQVAFELKNQDGIVKIIGA
jgi:hypothetical protein